MRHDLRARARRLLRRSDAKLETRAFISHRRDQAANDAKAIADRLRDKLPGVFIDAQMEAGEDLHAELDQHLDVADVMIAVIHPRWGSVDSDAQRLQDPRDWVRIEIATALQRGLPVVPVLVRGAQLPRVEAVPSVLRALANTNPFRLPYPPDPYWAALTMRVAEELRQADEARKNQADVAVRRAEVSGSLEWAGRLRGDQVTVHRDIAARLAGALLVARMRWRLLAREPEGFVLLRRNHDTVEELVVSLGPDAQATRTRVSMSAPQGMRRPFERVVREVFATQRVDSSC